MCAACCVTAAVTHFHCCLVVTPVTQYQLPNKQQTTTNQQQDQMPYESKQGCRDALSHNTDIFTLGLLGYKILLGPQLPPELDWYSK